jgi:hypothetical protein
VVVGASVVVVVVVGSTVVVVVVVLGSVVVVVVVGLSVVVVVVVVGATVVVVVVVGSTGQPSELLQERVPPVIISPSSPVTAVEEHTIEIVSASIDVDVGTSLPQFVYV